MSLTCVINISVRVFVIISNDFTEKGCRPSPNVIFVCKNRTKISLTIFACVLDIVSRYFRTLIQFWFQNPTLRVDHLYMSFGVRTKVYLTGSIPVWYSVWLIKDFDCQVQVLKIGKIRHELKIADLEKSQLRIQWGRGNNEWS